MKYLKFSLPQNSALFRGIPVLDPYSYPPELTKDQQCQSPFVSSTDCIFIFVKVWLWVKSTAIIQILLFLRIHYVCTQFRNNEILLKFTTTLQELKKNLFPSFLAISFFFFFFFFLPYSAWPSLWSWKLAAVIAVQISHSVITAVTLGLRGTKKKKRPYRLLALNTGRNQTGSQCVISRPIKPHQEQQGGKCFTSSSHSLTFVENYSN